MRFLFILFVGILMFQACNNVPSGQTQYNSSIEVLFQDYYEDGKALYPISATSEGDNRYNHIFYNGLTAAYRQRQADYYKEYLDKLEAYDRNSLDENDRVSYDVLKWECAINLESLGQPDHLFPITQNGSMASFMAQLGSGESLQPFESIKDYDNWLSRVGSFPEWCDTAIANMRIGIEKGIVLPVVLIEKALPQFAEFDHGPSEEHIFYEPINSMPDSFDVANKERLKTAYRSMIEQDIIPAYSRLHRFLKEEYLPACRESSGIGHVPGGSEVYDHRIRYYTTTNMSADEIFEIGQSEVRRILKEMEKVKEQVGFEGTMQEFFDYVRTSDDLLVYTEPQQVIDNFEAIHERMKPHLEKMFDKVPKAAFEIRRTEAYREATASWEYQQPSMDGTRPGIFYVPIPDVTKYNGYSDENTFLHEAIPGHHYQIALQMENESLPDFRKTLWYSAYGEGWALYTESLGEELGLYKDPYQYLGGLSWDMHRAIRLVVDVGMHVKGWSREDAIAFSLENEAEPEHTIIREIERYMADPGQALSYKIGQLKIIELRNLAQEKLGMSFDIREFHNIILEPGCVPIKVLEDHVHSWIDGEISG
ncbi:MAG: DUF885 domain-containing protein [Bacteroidetes bacterium]|nr:DUF885 domain-containing protein [Bacteroidota bacterium]